MLTLATQAATERREWADIPGVWVIGLVIGGTIIVAAIRYMIKKK